MSETNQGGNLPAELQNSLGEVAGGWQLKFAKLAVKLVGATVGQEALRKAGDELDAFRGRAMVSDALAAAAAKRAASDPAIVDRWMARHIDKELTGQENLETVTRIAAEELKRDTGIEEPTESVSDDWRRKFSSFAEDVSDAEMQRIWGRMLAGEFKAPGTFSFRTVRLLSELDVQTAQKFANFASDRFAESAVYSPKGRYSTGHELAVSSELLSLGLVADRAEQVHRPINQENGRYFVWGSWWSGMIVSPIVTQLEIPMIRFTEAGKQLLRLLERPNEAATIESILLALRGQLGGESVAVMGPNDVAGVFGSFNIARYLWGSKEDLRRLSS